MNHTTNHTPLSPADELAEVTALLEREQRAHLATKADLTLERSYRSLERHAWDARREGKGMEACPVEPCAFIQALANDQPLSFGMSDQYKVEAGMVWRSAWESADEFLTPLEAERDQAQANNAAFVQALERNREAFAAEGSFVVAQTFQAILEGAERAGAHLLEELAALRNAAEATRTAVYCFEQGHPLDGALSSALKLAGYRMVALDAICSREGR